MYCGEKKYEFVSNYLFQKSNNIMVKKNFRERKFFQLSYGIKKDLSKQLLPITYTLEKSFLQLPYF